MIKCFFIFSFFFNHDKCLADMKNNLFYIFYLENRNYCDRVKKYFINLLT